MSSYFYATVGTNIDEDFFKVGKLYRLKKDLVQATNIVNEEEIENNTVLFFKANFLETENILKLALDIPIGQPMIYLGIQDNAHWQARFHIFLYHDMKVYTFGLLNSCPATYWEEIKPAF